MPSNQSNNRLTPPARDRRILSVSQLNRQVKRLLEGEFPSVWVEGELSNLAQPSSGHWYFSLKDSNAQIRCAMFRSANNRLRIRPEPGQQVQVRAKLSLYEARGDYQLIVEHMEPAGAGALAAAFAALRDKLQAEGLFEADRKQPLPEIPGHIAVITSPTGAAIRDILTVLGRRFPAIPVTIFPVSVQGQTAAPEIAAAIDLANRLAADGSYDFDVILTGRGGGSLEDLWAFNEEVVARAIARSGLPVVSAVGHEVDITIADFVADSRAPTPSAAAELLSPDQREWLETLLGYEQLLARQIRQKLGTLGRELTWLANRLEQRHPGSRLREHSQRLDELELRLRNGWRQGQALRRRELALARSQLQQHNPATLLPHRKQGVENLCQRLQRQMRQALERQQQRLHSAAHLLDSVSPLATLNRGYSITEDADGRVVQDAGTLAPGDQLRTRLAHGQVTSRVEAIEESGD